MSKDCIILVADLDAENAVRGLLARQLAINCRAFTFDVFRHPRRDPGVRLESGEFIRSFSTDYAKAVLILDWHGSGAEPKTAPEIEHEIETGVPADWRGRVIAVVIDPELEAWVWSDSPEVDNTLGWHGRKPTLREWLYAEKLSRSEGAKPTDPKLAYDRALRHVGKTRSASLFRSLAESVSTRRCSDRAFLKLREALGTWFPNQQK